MAGLKGNFAVLVVGLALTAFALAQWRDNIRKETRLEVQAESLERFERLADKIDEAMLEWRKDHAAIADQRQETRELTRQTARSDPTFQDFLDTPLHPALRPGGGLLGAQGHDTQAAGASPGAHAPDPGP